VELAKNRWINQMSQREIANSMGITRGQVDWNLKKFKKAISELSDSTDLVEDSQKDQRGGVNMKSLGELLFGLILLFLTGNLAKQQIYKPLKQETVMKVSAGLGSLELFSSKLTQRN
jgi:IS30 family transposase